MGVHAAQMGRHAVRRVYRGEQGVEGCRGLRVGVDVCGGVDGSRVEGV